jgi:hypothetical protein
MATQKHKPKRRLKLNPASLASARQAASKSASRKHQGEQVIQARLDDSRFEGLDPWLLCMIFSRASVAFEDRPAPTSAPTKNMRRLASHG